MINRIYNTNFSSHRLGQFSTGVDSGAGLGERWPAGVEPGREYETGELVNEFVFERRVEVGV